MNTFLISLSDITKGLNRLIPRRAGVRPSKGIITPEMNNNKLPKEIEARTPVSSEVKMQPIPIPKKEKTEAVTKSIKATLGKTFKIFSKNNNEISKIIKISIAIMITVVK